MGMEISLADGGSTSYAGLVNMNGGGEQQAEQTTPEKEGKHTGNMLNCRDLVKRRERKKDLGKRTMFWFDYEAVDEFGVYLNAALDEKEKIITQQQ